MAVPQANPFSRERLSQDLLQEWQLLLDSTAALLDVPAGLITRVDGDTIEILLSSRTEGNPYPVDVVEPFPDSGWFCEHTLKSRELNLIPDAEHDPKWHDNSAVTDLSMVSYAGMPINLPGGGQFGTVCFLDNKSNAHNELHIRLIQQVKRMVELSLRVLWDKEELERRESLLRGLSRIYPICCYCKKVQDNEGRWKPVEVIVDGLSGSRASHGVCPECFEREKERLGL